MAGLTRDWEARLAAVQQAAERAAGDAQRAAAEREVLAGELARVNAQSAFIRQVASLTPDQLAFVGRVKSSVILEAGAIEPAEYISLPGAVDLLSRADVHEYMQDCGPGYLCPIGHYGEGSEARRVAEEITAFMVANRYAEAAAGNRPARWLLREAGLKAIGEGA